MNDELTRILTGLATQAVNNLGASVVITAPNGQQLFIPVQLPGTNDGAQSSLLSGFKINLTLKQKPNLPHVTDSVGKFVTDQGPRLLWTWATAKP